ncbi:putative phage abortive infection protein [Mangrovimonas xylaniphaga]|uniref:putative phage abortive infection protein n=1 Tax=Mangrovimonas xylaniphaga TaxID=1645915 RepID=UPI0006B63B1C|nr:putative phage abortive infection protein [Mangrovimonas xylaniphaga]
MKKLKIILATLLTFIGFGIIVWFLIRGFFYEGFISAKSTINLTKSAQVGDFIGGFVGAIFTLVGILLLYETLSLQRQEFTESRKVFIKQQFDNTFFELLDLYKENLNQLKCYNFFGEELNGKAFFEHQKLQLSNSFNPSNTLSKNRKNAVIDFQKVYVNYEHYLSTYFRTLYRLYSLIDNSGLEEIDKSAYSKILRAQLSYSELFFIRYNAMTEQGLQSRYFINKYNILKHLSNFYLLEFKDWWSKIDDFEKNGLGTIFKEVKSVLIEFLTDEGADAISKDYKSGRYRLTLESENRNYFNINLIKDNNKTGAAVDISNGFERFTIEELENLLKCILKEFIIHSNFNEYNIRRELDFTFNVSNDNNIDNIMVGVTNTSNNPIIISYWDQKN